MVGKRPRRVDLPRQSEVFDAIDLTAPAGRYAVDHLSTKLFKDHWHDPIWLGRFMARESAKDAWQWGGFALVGPKRHEEAREIEAKLRKMHDLCSELDRIEQSNTMYEFLKIEGDDPIERHTQDIEDLVSAALNFRSAIQNFIGSRAIGDKPSLKNSRPIEREFIRSLKHFWQERLDKPMPMRRFGVHVDFAYASWHDAGLPELDPDDDVLALYIERLK